MKISLGNSAILNIKNDDKGCFLWSLLASLQPCNSSHPKRVSNYRQHSIEKNIKVFDVSKRLECCDMHRFEKLNNLSINLFELIFVNIKIYGTYTNTYSK